MFTFDLKSYQEKLKTDGYLYLPGGCSEGFMQKLDDMVQRIESDDPPEVFSVMPEGEDRATLFRAMEILTGETGFTISRHHVLMYRNITSYPHKDRKSLEFSCAIGIRPMPHSRLVLWPYAPRDENQGSHYRDYVDYKGGQDVLEAEIAEFPPVMFDVRRGDVVFFATSRIYHDRLNPEGVAIYYVAMNTYGLYDRQASRQERPPDGTTPPPPPRRVAR